MASAKETSDRVGKETRMERLLGMSKRHNPIILSLRFERREIGGSSAETSNHRGRGYHATNSRTSQKRLHLLLEYGLR